MRENSQRHVIQFGRELDLFLAEISTMGFIASLSIAVVAAIIIYQDGISAHSEFLLGGSLLSPLAIFGYVWLIIRKADSGGPKPGIGPMLVAVGGFVPYAFGCYLVFYEGLWGFVRLIDAFTFSSLFAKVFYLIAGYVIVHAIYRVSEFGRALDEGRVEVRKNAI
jgi:hypothetical protein